MAGSGLTAVLQAEVAAAERLLQLLHAERDALATRETAAIERSADLKQAALADLEARGRERTTFIERAGCGSGKAGVESYIETRDPGLRAALRHSWNGLLELAAECRRLNAINGAVIQSAYRHTQQALAILRGQPAASPLAYGPRGEVHPAAPSQTLAKA